MGSLPTLSQNGEKIIEKLLSLPPAWITSNTLAESIGISKRTIMRELPGVEKWFLAAGVELKRSQGKGILLELGESKREELKELSGMKGKKVFPEKEQRIREIFTMLLLSEEPVKQFLLADEVGVSERTLSGDLDQLSDWLDRQGLSLVRKSGVGIWLEGDEDSRRRAVNHLLYEQYPQETLDAMFKTGQDKGKFDISKLLDVETAAAVKEILHDFEITEALQFADAGFITLALHLSLLIMHLKEENADSHYNKVGDASEGKISAMAERLIRRLEDTFFVQIPTHQAEYLTRYLDAYRGRMSDEGPESHEMDVRYLASVLIQGIEAELCVDLSGYPSLADDLSNHLRAMLHRMQTGAYSDNPQLDLIRQQYSWLWDATRLACDLAYETQAYPDMQPISDEEAGFLAMHFGAVLERDDVAQMRIKTIIVCPLGLASSRFLTSQLVRDYPVLHIEKTCSVRDISREYLEKSHIDLVISTTPLKIDYPYIKVNTILQAIDHTLLDQAVKECHNKIRQNIKEKKESQAGKEPRKESSFAQGGPELRAETKKESTSNASGVRYLNRVSRMIIDLYENVKVKTVKVPGKRKKLIEEAAGLFARDARAKAEIEKGLLRREEIADTYIKPLRALLLHCKTGEIDGCRLGYLIAEPPVYEPGRLIQGALVLLASDEEDELPVKVMQSVSGLLIDNPRLMEALREGREEDAVKILDEGITQIYHNKRK